MRISRVVVATACVAIVAGALSGCSAPVLSNGGRDYTNLGCPSHHAIPPETALANANTMLVPFVPTQVAFCGYGVTSKPKQVWFTEMTGAGARSMAKEFNSAVTHRPAGAVNCPMATDASVVAYFANRHDHIVVRVLADGCQIADNGTQRQAWVAENGLGTELAALFN